MATIERGREEPVWVRPRADGYAMYGIGEVGASFRQLADSPPPTGVGSRRWRPGAGVLIANR